MIAMQFQEGMNSTEDLRMWNNAAFDNGDSEDLTFNRQSWGSIKSIFANPKSSFDSVSDKENHGFTLENQVSSVFSALKSSTTPLKPVNTDGTVEKSRITRVSKEGLEENMVLKQIDEEIGEIETEISRLSSRLMSLSLEKAEKNLKTVEKVRFVLPYKFLGQKSSVKNAAEKKKIENISSMSAKTNSRRRGLSLGLAEIAAVGRKGISMGPMEIYGSLKSRQLSKQEMITPVQSRRESCVWKLQNIDEMKVVIKEVYKSLSSSPKSKNVAAELQVSTRQAVTTITSKKVVKKDGVINAIQPKKLFKDGENSVLVNNKKPLRSGRVVASRYNQKMNQESAMRKKSLPGKDKDDCKGCDIQHSLSVDKSRVIAIESKNLGAGSRVKKRWEIPSHIVDRSTMKAEKSPQSMKAEKSPQSIVVVPDLLPRIRITRCTKESPRDSGPAKRVVDLIGRKSFFCHDDGVEEPSICPGLTYAEEDIEES